VENRDMANRLKMAIHDAILQLHAQHWSRRRIARELGIDRATVKRHLQGARGVPARQENLSNAAILPAGSDAPNAATFLQGPAPAGDPAGDCCPPATGENPNAAISPAGSCLDIHGTTATNATSRAAPEEVGTAPRSGRPSLCEPFRAVIGEKLQQELSAQRIYQDLTVEHGYHGGYDSVKRFVRRLGGQMAPYPMRRMECAPGFEAQVDYGAGAPIITPEGKRRRTHVFRIVLSHSRKGYSEVSFRQTTEDFLRCLENAFWHFGGVPQTIVIDNLKAAVPHPDWYDPELHPKLRSFCEHYRTAILPTRPYTPRHKGKIERGIGFVKGNALKARTFAGLAEQNEHLARWEQTVADTRIHGTTRQHVGQVFMEIERPALQALPAERFPCFHEAQRIVNRDGHIEVAKAYYSVPPEYLGRTVWARWDARLVRVFNQRMEQIAVHVRHEQGRFSTHGAHVAPQKISGIERGARWLLARVSVIGPHTGAWAEAMLTARGVEGTRVLMGLVALTKKHSSFALEGACRAALAHGEFHLRAVRALIARQPQVVQAALPFLEEHPLIRPLDDYARVVASALERKSAGNGLEARPTSHGDATVRFTRHGRANECSHNERKSPGPGTAAKSGGPADQGSRDIHPPGSGYSSPGCSPAGPDSASPDSSSIRPLLPPVPPSEGETPHAQ
jgi:transposase